jgi:hypothetical protein
MLTRQNVAVKKKVISRKNRVMSMNDLDTLETASDLNDIFSATPSASRLPMNAMRSVVVPIYSNQVALKRSTEALLRRQSFPSLENDLWKIGTMSQGLL